MARPSAGRKTAARAEPEAASLAHQLRTWAGTALDVAGLAAEVSLGVARSMMPKPGQKRALERAGAFVHDMREAAGLSIEDLSRALGLSAPSLLEQAEGGRIALPFEIVLRLAAVVARNDPVSFVMRLTRSYHPELWKTLEKLGVGRLAVQIGRERELANIYRANDRARGLTDAQFNAALAFTRSAFEAAVQLAAQPAGRAPEASRRRPKTAAA
ncbi:MAG: hypothetical protein Fur0039_25730 [Rhodocyclaceae bacterium]